MAIVRFIVKATVGEHREQAFSRWCGGKRFLRFRGAAGARR
jgi:hypothetical protein